MSEEVETYSTPPSSPVVLDDLAHSPDILADNIIRPSLSRKNSRPSLLSSSLSLSSLHTNITWHHDVVVEQQPESPAASKTPHLGHGCDNPDYGPARHDFTVTPQFVGSPGVSSGSSSSSSCSSSSSVSMPIDPKDISMKSPCFVHSHLDKGALLQGWLRTKENETLGADVGVAKSLKQHRPVELPCPALLGDDDDDQYGGSLTKQLAETAVGVREMSKQLGRARINSNIQSVLIVTKARDNRLIKLTRELALYLMLKPRQGDRGLIVYVDYQLRNSRRFDAARIERDHPELFDPLPRRRSSSSNSLSSLSSLSAQQDDGNGHQEGQLRYWTSDMCSRSPHLFDFVITLGGDGTVLFTSWLFQRIVPPVLPFALGSLGFLTNFDFADYQAVVDSAIDSGIRVNLRMRFTCTVYRAVFDKAKRRKAVKKAETGEIMMKDVNKGGWEALEGGWPGTSGFTTSEGGRSSKDKEIMCFTTRPVETFEVLNDLVVDRGPSPYVSLLELFGDEHHMTTVQADGLCVATPTGSTAYSLSAGGSLVHPEIPAILISPICPHTLSFRPMLLPDTMELRICVPYNSRSTAWVSFDGRGRVELQQGDHIKITASKYPFPTVCADKQSTDWFHAISRTLKWNERERQKSFVVVEEGPSRKNNIPDQTKQVDSFGVHLEDEEEDETSDDDEDDKFDINDSSPEASTSGRSIHIPNELNAKDASIGLEKAREEAGSEANEDLLSTPVLAALALTQNRRHLKFSRSAKSRSRSRSGLHSGVDTPGRFAGPTHRPPYISPHHHHQVDHQGRIPSPAPSSSSEDSLSNMDVAQRGARDDIYSREHYSSARSRIPKDREFDDNLQTPTMADIHSEPRNHHRVNSKEHDYHHPHAFAVWGNDESDSNASDSDA